MINDTFNTLSLIDVDHVPNFQKGLPFLATLLISECLVLWIQGKPIPRFNDSVTSLSLGLLQECTKIIFQGFVFAMYTFIHDNYRLIDLCIGPVWSWIFTCLLIDFGFYWVHRASHEFNILWGHHQVHHSADDFNFAVGFRHGAFNNVLTLVAYSPMALVFRPTALIVHHQLNLFYQLWVHTEVIGSLGPLDWVLVTPEHHQVHHGRNGYLLDKNYGGIFIIWDKMFGTFVIREPGEIVYGIVYPPESFNPIKLQTYHYVDLWRRLKRLKSWKEKVQAVVKGPAWEPGSPWTGWKHLKPKLTSRPKFDVPVPRWRKLYVAIHFIVLIVIFRSALTDPTAEQFWHQMNGIYLLTTYVALTVFVFGSLLDNRPSWVCCVELFRCILSVTNAMAMKNLALQFLFGSSTALWTFITICYLYSKSRI